MGVLEYQNCREILVTCEKHRFCVYLIWFITSQSTIFQKLCQDSSSLVEPVGTKQGLMGLAEGHNAVTLVRLEPATPQS